MTEKPRLILRDDQPRTTSLAVAEYFGMLHKNVLRTIRRLELDCPDPDWYRLNFELCFSNNGLQNGKPQPHYEMTKDGFTMLTFGFTGAAAFAWKLRYIAAFNAMQQILTERREKELRAGADKAIAEAEAAEADAQAYQKDVVAMARQVLAEMEVQVRADATAAAAKLHAQDIAGRMGIPTWSTEGGYLSEAFMLMFFALKHRYTDAVLLWTLYDEFGCGNETRTLSARAIVDASGRALCRNTVYLSRQRLIARGLLLNLDATEWRINREPFEQMMRETQLVADVQRVPAVQPQAHGFNKKLAGWLERVTPKTMQ